MAKDSQSRKWQVTINNPAEKDITHDTIKERLSQIENLEYWCMCDEIGEKGTYHIHTYLTRPSAIRFSTIKKLFPEAHLEMAKGTSQQNRDYIRKEGKWEKDKKKETNLPETFEEMGECPIERQGARTDLADLYDMIKCGMYNLDILEEQPHYMLNLDKIERARQIVREGQYKNTFRKLEVTYIFGKSGAGKTRGVMEMYGYDKVYRVTDYDKHPWDGYDGQDVVVFEEFRSSFKVQEMLNYLDGYPLQLPCRYNNKTACFTKVYIITNIRLEDQYKAVQTEYPETWEAFLRRIHKVKEYSESGISEYSKDEYLHRHDWVKECEDEVPEEWQEVEPLF